MPRISWVSAGVLAAWAGLFLPGVAQAEIIDCATQPAENDGFWLTNRYVFNVDPAARTVEVVDGLIAQVSGGPIAGKLVTYTDKQFAAAWDVLVISSTGQRTKLAFRGTYFRQLNQFQVTAKPVGYRDIFDAPGNCTVK